MSASQLAGRIALVTGASSGIGWATAVEFCRAGASVAIVGRSRAALERLEAQCKEENANAGVLLCEADLRDNACVRDVIDRSASHFGGLDVLVNSAGVLIGGATQDTTMQTFDENFAINTRAVFAAMSAAIPHMQARGGGAITNISSVNGVQSFPGTMAYCASKAAVDQMTRCAAVDLAPLNIRCNAINPGVVVTELQKRGGMTDEAYETFLERCKETHPLYGARPICLPEDVARTVAFMSSDAARCMTGACIVVDGGRACNGAR